MLNLKFDESEIHLIPEIIENTEGFNGADLEAAEKKQVKRHL